MGADVSQLKAFRERLKNLREKELDEFYRRCAKTLAKRLLDLVIPKTPIGKNTYEKIDIGGGVMRERVVKNGGTLKRGWTAQTETEAAGGSGEPGISEIMSYIQSLEITNNGGTYEIEIVNPVFYASYVEYGHRQDPGRFVPAIGKRLVSPWSPGKFMLKISEHELIAESPQILERELEKMLREGLDG